MRQNDQLNFSGFVEFSGEKLKFSIFYQNNSVLIKLVINI
jgi:hypothetical protein